MQLLKSHQVIKFIAGVCALVAFFGVVEGENVVPQLIHEVPRNMIAILMLRKLDATNWTAVI